MKVYISGQITGLDEEVARKAFLDAKIYLEELGHEAINPFDIEPGVENPTYMDYMTADIAVLLTCEAVFMLNEWLYSNGAMEELDEAIKAEKFIFFQSRTGDGSSRDIEMCSNK